MKRYRGRKPANPHSGSNSKRRSGRRRPSKRKFRVITLRTGSGSPEFTIKMGNGRMVTSTRTSSGRSSTATRTGSDEPDTTMKMGNGCRPRKRDRENGRDECVKGLE
jgi:hypothetical protein